MKLFWKKIKAPASNKTRELKGIRLWYVEWYSRQGEFSTDTTKEVEAFTSELDANEFAVSLRCAFELIRHVGANKIRVYTKDCS